MSIKESINRIILQWNLVNTDTKGTGHSVLIIRVSVLSRLSEKMSGTHVLSIYKDQSRQFNEKTLFNFLTATVTSSS